jgi:sugar/nucleoside kinase (ribokinase family)
MILSLGEVLVEIMRVARGVPLNTPGVFSGPYASGAPAIFACAAARLGAPARFAGTRGDDTFGELCEQYLRQAGVETQAIRMDAAHTTGMAFVSYDHQGDREFLFHLPRSAAALLGPEDVTREIMRDVTWLHVTGSSLGVSESMRQAIYRAVDVAKSAGATVSFDPNLRLELMSPQDIKRLCGPLLDHADIVLPSGAEASHLTGIHNQEDACLALLAGGARTVVLKLGDQGCALFTPERVLHIPSIPVTEVDPTGAGDCFAAAFTVAVLEGKDLRDAARFANVAGALSTTVLGPMEGAARRGEVEAKLEALT